MVQELQQYSIPVRRYSQQYYVSSSQSPSTFIILRQNISSRFTHAHHVLTASMLAVKTSMYGEPLAFTHLKVRVLLVQYIRKHTFFFVHGSYAKPIITSLPDGVEHRTIGKCSTIVY